MTNEKMIEMFRTVIEDWDDNTITSELDLRPRLLDVFHRISPFQMSWIVKMFLEAQKVC